MTCSVSKDQLVEEENRNPDPWIPGPALSHKAMETSMLAHSYSAVYLLASTCPLFLRLPTNSEVLGASSLSASILYLLILFL